MQTITSLEPLQIFSHSRLLVIMPHPDDETVFTSGLMQKAIALGSTVAVIVVTSGEKSTLRHRLPPAADLATARKAELARAMEIIGVTKHEIWKFPDGAVEDHHQPLKQKLVKAVKQQQPSHIITIEPDGVYGHPDHIALTKVVEDVMVSMANRSVRLLYATVKPHFIFPKSRRMAKKAVIEPLHPDYELKLHHTEVRKKWRAMKAHRSQFKLNGSDLRAIVGFLLNKMLTHEYYTFRK